MSDGSIHFSDKLRPKLNRSEERWHRLITRIRSDPRAGREEVERAVDAAQATLQRGKDDAAAAKARILAQTKDRKAETKDVIAEWRCNRELQKLERRAEDLEAYAAWSVIVATTAIDAADLAALQAIEAQLDFEMTADNKGRRG